MGELGADSCGVSWRAGGGVANMEKSKFALHTLPMFTQRKMNDAVGKDNASVSFCAMSGHFRTVCSSRVICVHALSLKKRLLSREHPQEPMSMDN